MEKARSLLGGGNNTKIILISAASYTVIQVQCLQTYSKDLDWPMETDASSPLLENYGPDPSFVVHERRKYAIAVHKRLVCRYCSVSVELLDPQKSKHMSAGISKSIQIRAHDCGVRVIRKYVCFRWSCARLAKKMSRRDKPDASRSPIRHFPGIVIGPDAQTPPNPTFQPGWQCEWTLMNYWSLGTGTGSRNSRMAWEFW
jgi:hypothetical protein